MRNHSASPTLCSSRTASKTLSFGNRVSCLRCLWAVLFSSFCCSRSVSSYSGSVTAWGANARKSLPRTRYFYMSTNLRGAQRLLSCPSYSFGRARPERQDILFFFRVCQLPIYTMSTEQDRCLRYRHNARRLVLYTRTRRTAADRELCI